MSEPKRKPASSTALQQIRQRRARTLTSIVREEIGQLISNGELAAGERVNESELASRLGVSRGPVREACRSLEEAGLLMSVVNQGVFVREMTTDDARQLYEVRGALSGLIGRLAATNITPEGLQQLQEQVLAMEAAAEHSDMPRYYQLNLRFHEQLMTIASNQPLADIYLSIVNQTHLFRRRGLVQQGSLQTSNAEHRLILQALRDQDPDGAEQALSRHVARGWERLLGSIEPR